MERPLSNMYFGNKTNFDLSYSIFDCKNSNMSFTRQYTQIVMALK